MFDSIPALFVRVEEFMFTHVSMITFGSIYLLDTAQPNVECHLPGAWK